MNGPSNQFVWWKYNVCLGKTQKGICSPATLSMVSTRTAWKTIFFCFWKNCFTISSDWTKTCAFHGLFFISIRSDADWCCEIGHTLWGKNFDHSYHFVELVSDLFTIAKKNHCSVLITKIVERFCCKSPKYFLDCKLYQTPQRSRLSLSALIGWVSANCVKVSETMGYFFEECSGLVTKDVPCIWPLIICDKIRNPNHCGWFFEKIKSENQYNLTQNTANLIVVAESVVYINQRSI